MVQKSSKTVNNGWNIYIYINIHICISYTFWNTPPTSNNCYSKSDNPGVDCCWESISTCLHIDLNNISPSLSLYIYDYLMKPDSTPKKRAIKIQLSTWCFLLKPFVSINCPSVASPALMQFAISSCFHRRPLKARLIEKCNDNWAMKKNLVV